MTRTLHDRLPGPFLAALLFLGSVVAARSLTATFWLAPSARTLVQSAPLLFLLLFVSAQWRFFRRAAGEQRAFFYEAILFATITTVSVLALGETFAFLGGRLWDPTEIWHWVALLACLLGVRRARSRTAAGLKTNEVAGNIRQPRS
ncbi:MAG: hypothetical protein ACRD4D_07650 [Candidatus Acidiferrales bacterium]